VPVAYIVSDLLLVAGCGLFVLWLRKPQKTTADIVGTLFVGLTIFLVAGQSAFAWVRDGHPEASASLRLVVWVQLLAASVIASVPLMALVGRLARRPSHPTTAS
jgi:hypothetical protein